MNQKKLKKRLNWLFDNRTHAMGMTPDGSLEKYRYMPKAFSSAGSGWGVWDGLSQKFLSDEEVCDLPLERLQTATVLN